MKPTLNHAAVFCTLSAVIICLGLLDAQIPREVTFFVIYLLPLSIGAYLLSTRATIVLALISSLTWMISDYLTNPSYTHHSIFFWNFFVRSAAFFGISAIIQYFRSALDHQKEIIEEYRLASQNTATLEGSHLLCDSCGRLASQNDRWLTPLDFITETPQVTLHSCICPTCLGRLKLGQRGVETGVPAQEHAPNDHRSGKSLPTPPPPSSSP